MNPKFSKSILLCFGLWIALGCQSQTIQSQTAKPIANVAQPESSSGFQDKTSVMFQSMGVSSAHPEASRAGLDVLKNGGTAVDAAVAVQMVLNVVEPQSSGIGGGAFIVYFDAAKKEVVTFDGRETAPQKIRGTVFQKTDGTPKDFFEALVGGQSVGVPGVVKLLEVVQKKHGNQKWSSLFDHAIELAQHGVPLTSRTHNMLKLFSYVKNSPQARELYFEKDGETAKPIGSLIKNPELAESFKLIAQSGSEVFYKGELAKKIVHAVHEFKKNPGTLTLEDLRNYQIVVRPGLCDEVSIYWLCGMGPPSSGGLAVLQILRLLEESNSWNLKPDDLNFISRFAQAGHLAFADRDAYVADPSFAHVPTPGFLDDAYLKQRAKKIGDQNVRDQFQEGDFRTQYSGARSPELVSTTNFTIKDSKGNVLVMTSSIENGFGSTVMAGGFFLNNTLTDFSFVEKNQNRAVANRVQPRKRPRSSMAPFVVLNSDRSTPVMAIGSAGGANIILHVARSLHAVLAHGFDVQDAFELPHVSGRNMGLMHVEKSKWAADEIQVLKSKGHKVEEIEINSGLHGMVFRNGNGFGGADPRRDGVVLGQ